MKRLSIIVMAFVLLLTACTAAPTKEPTTSPQKSASVKVFKPTT